MCTELNSKRMGCDSQVKALTVILLKYWSCHRNPSIWPSNSIRSLRASRPRPIPCSQHLSGQQSSDESVANNATLPQKRRTDLNQVPLRTNDFSTPIRLAKHHATFCRQFDNPTRKRGVPPTIPTWGLAIVLIVVSVVFNAK